MKKGRPTNPESKKGRTHVILLTMKAEFVLREIKKKRQQFNLSRYVTEHIIQDFGNNNTDINTIRMEMNSLNKDVAEKEARITELVEKIRVIKVNQMEKEEIKIEGLF